MPATATVPCFSPSLLADIESHREVLTLILQDICLQGGASYDGILTQMVPQVPVLVLFSSLKNHNTLTLPLTDITPMKVAARVRESDLAFDAANRPRPEPTPSLASIQPPTLKLACLVHQRLNREGQCEWNEIVARLRAIRRTKRKTTGVR